MIYLDASLVVSAITKEVHTPASQDWIRRQPVAGLCISEWVSTEVASALSLKVRSNRIPLVEQTIAWAAYRRMIEDGLQILPVKNAHFGFANEMIWTCPDLRSGDALHLAIAKDFGVAVCALDDVMLDAGPMVGVLTISPLAQ